MKPFLITLLVLATAACAGPQPGSGQESSPSAAPTGQPTALADCVTAVGAERTQCRAQ